jgi:hypothetical protein
MRGLLSEFALGPAWARAGTSPQILKPRPEVNVKGGEREPRRGDYERGGRERDDRRPSQGRRENFTGRREGPPQVQESGPAQGIRVILNPDPQAIHLIGREVHQVARVYPLFDVARILLAERGRCRAVFEVESGEPRLFLGRLDDSLFLTRDEAIRHLWHSDLSKQLVEEETIAVDPPTGRFHAVARCGISGVLLGPPNHHSYQTNLRRLHRERFGNMPFEVYSSKVRTERSEEAVNAWLETMKQKVRWRIKGDAENAWIEDRAEAERVVATRCFEAGYAEVATAEVSAAIPPNHISPALLTSLRMTGSHASQHPAILIPAVCRALEAEHLPVFKRLGKLHTGPARPHALAPDIVLAERPAAMVEWIRNNKPAKLAGLWQAVLPEGVTEPTPEYAADLFWLLHQGHILLYADDKLAVQEPHVITPPKKSKAPKNHKLPAAPADPTAAPTAAQAATATLLLDGAPAEVATVEDVTVEDVTVEVATVAVEDATVEDAAAEDAADEDAAVEDAPVEDAPVEDAPVEDAPVEDAPVEDAPVEDAPVEDAPVEDAPVEDAPVEDAAVEDAAVEDAAVEDAAVEDVTVEVATVVVEDVTVEDAVIAEAPITPATDDAPEPTPSPAEEISEAVSQDAEPLAAKEVSASSENPPEAAEATATPEPVAGHMEPSPATPALDEPASTKP